MVAINFWRRIIGWVSAVLGALLLVFTAVMQWGQQAVPLTGVLFVGAMGLVAVIQGLNMIRRAASGQEKT